MSSGRHPSDSHPDWNGDSPNSSSVSLDTFPSASPHEPTFVPPSSSRLDNNINSLGGASPSSAVPSFPPSYTPNDDSAPTLPRTSTSADSPSSSTPIDFSTRTSSDTRRNRGYSLRTQLFAKNLSNQNESTSPIELQPQPFSRPSESFGPNNTGRNPSSFFTVFSIISLTFQKFNNNPCFPPRLIFPPSPKRNSP